MLIVSPYTLIICILIYIVNHFNKNSNPRARVLILLGSHPFSHPFNSSCNNAPQKVLHNLHNYLNHKLLTSLQSPVIIFFFYLCIDNDRTILIPNTAHRYWIYMVSLIIIKMYYLASFLLIETKT